GRGARHAPSLPNFQVQFCLSRRGLTAGDQFGLLWLSLLRIVSLVLLGLVGLDCDRRAVSLDQHRGFLRTPAYLLLGLNSRFGLRIVLVRNLDQLLAFVFTAGGEGHMSVAVIGFLGFSVVVVG